MSSFSSLIEFVAAIYVTMSLDTLFSKSFWTPDYVKKVERTLNAVGIPSALITKLSEVISATSANEQRKGSLLGMMMLMYSVSLLICIGFEPTQIHNDASVIGYNNAITLSAIIIFAWFVILSFCKNFSFKIILCVYGITVVISLVSYLLLNIVAYINTPIQGIIVVGALLFPIIIQLFRNWLYSTIYLKYMEQKVGGCYEKYAKAVDFNGEEITSIDTKYQNAVHAAMISKDSQDKRIGDFVRILEDDVSQYVKVPSAYLLLASWLRYQRDYKKNTQPSNLKKQRIDLLDENVLGK